MIKKTLSKTVTTQFITGYDSFEGISCTITVSKKKINVVNLYRPPINSKSEFLNHFDLFLSTILEGKGKFVIFGDFNVDYLTDDRIKEELTRLLELYDLVQIVDKSTREDSLLDYVIVQTTDVSQ